ncbi:MAG: hypothetical protein MUF10_11320, partial [Thermoanaerobaculaceae bacterium]|nr:hypothetical protein [Thermoanaerobaculaceae bacterium]
VRPMAPSIAMWFDEGWFDDTEVYKLIPDAAGPASRTWLDVVAELSVDSSEPVDLYLTVVVPDDEFGEPAWAHGRDCTGCEWTDHWVDDLDGGRYRVNVHLEGDSPPFRRQVVMRFGVGSGDSVGSLRVSAEAQLTGAGSVIGTGISPELHLVDEVSAVILTSRHHLYEGSYDLAQATTLLGTVTQAAQGPPRGPAGSLTAAVYFVDDYSELARDWCNESWDPSSEDTANVVTRAIDELLDDWLEDSDGNEEVVILGDDDVIPFFRRTCPCEGEESGHTDTSHPALNLLTANDYIGTDNHYGDTNHDGWDHGRLELNVGRIIGDSPIQMQNLFENGLAGPSPGPDPRAVLASCDGPDLDFTGDEGVLDHIRAWGYSAASDMVDNLDWRGSDLLAALGDQFAIFAFGDHANQNGIGTPPKPQKGGLFGDELVDAMDNVDSAARRPFVGILGCRSGYSLVSGSMLDYFAGEGVSGVVAHYGTTWHSPEGSEWYTEDVMNKFWRRTMPDSGETRSVGTALRRAKIAHDPTSWYCRHETAVQQATLFGIPWMTIPRGESGARPAGAAAGAEPLADSIRAMAEGSYELTSTIDIPSWSIDRTTAPGFALIEIEGFAQDPNAGPTLPGRMLQSPLPEGVEVTAVEVRGEQALSLGTLAIPRYEPGVYLVGPGTESTWEATPATIGTVPAQPFSFGVVPAQGHTMLQVKVVPVVYDAATGQTTLYRRLQVRIAYATAEPIGVIEGGLDKHRQVPGEAGTGWADVVNASSAPVEVTTLAVLRDADGSEVARATGGPFTVAGGATARLAAPLPLVQAEGGFDVDVRVLRGGSELSRIDDSLQATTGFIRELRTPPVVVPGSDGTFTVTYASLRAEATEVELGIAILSESGKPIETLQPLTVSVPANGAVTASFAWDARSVTLGRYQVKATATPAGAAARHAWRVVDVRAGRPVRRHLTQP